MTVFRGLRVRCGVHTCLPRWYLDVNQTGRVYYTGPEVENVTLLAAAANGGQILITDHVHRDVQWTMESRVGQHVLFSDMGRVNLVEGSNLG